MKDDKGGRPVPYDLEKVSTFPVYGLGVVLVGWKPMWVDILTAPDADGRLIHIPRVYGKDDFLALGIEETGIENGQLSEDQRQRLVYCIEVLKLPPLLATYLTFEAGDRDLSKYDGEGLEDAEIPALVAICGQPHMGKSTLTALIALKEGCPVVNMALFDEAGAEEYLSKMIERGVRAEDLAKCLEVVEECRQESNGKERRLVTVRERLERMLKIFEGGNRPEVTFLDMPGMSDNRILHIADLVAHFSTCPFLISPREGAEYTLEELMRDYLGNWDSLREQTIGWANNFDSLFLEVLRA